MRVREWAGPTQCRGFLYDDVRGEQALPFLVSSLPPSLTPPSPPFPSLPSPPLCTAKAAARTQERGQGDNWLHSC